MQYFSQTFSGTYDGILLLMLLFAVFFIPLVLVIVVLFPILFISGHVRRKAEEIKNQRISSIIVQYEPPRGLSPAEVGYLYNLKCGKNELIATLFDLELRGIIKINNGNTADVIDDKSYALLQEYEKIAIRSVNQIYATSDKPTQVPFTYILNNGAQQTLMYNLPPQKSLRAFTSGVQKSLIEKDFPVKSFWLSVFMRSFLIALILCLIPFFFIVSRGAILNDTPYQAWSLTAFGVAAFASLVIDLLAFPAYMIFGGMIVYLWSAIAGRYWLNTKKARAVWPELEGYKKFIESVDLDNIQFEATDSQGYTVKETLPYAIVFNLETKWQQLLAKREKQLKI